MSSVSTNTKPPFHNRLTHLLTSAHLLASTSPAAAAHLLRTCHGKAWDKEGEVMLSRGTAGQGFSSGSSGGGCKRCGGVWVLGVNCGVGSGKGGVVKRGVGQRRKEKLRVGREKRKGGREKEGANKAEEGKKKAEKKKQEEKDDWRGRRWVEWECGMCGYIAKGEIPSRPRRSGKKRKIQQLGIGGKVEIIPSSPSATTITNTSTVSTIMHLQTQPVQIPTTQEQVHSPSLPPVLGTAKEGVKIKEQLHTAPVAQTPIQPANQRAKERKKKKNSSLQEMLAAKRKQESSSAASGNGRLGGMDIMDLMKLG